MKKETSYKIIAVIALILGIVGLSIGFAAFSKTLNISSATVNTTARTNVFLEAVHFDTTTGAGVLNRPERQMVLTNATVQSAGTLTADTWSGISFTIDSNTQSVVIVPLGAYMVNDSPDYDAYLERIYSDGSITCTASSGTSQDLVDDYCSCAGVMIYRADGTMVATFGGSRTLDVSRNNDSTVRSTYIPKSGSLGYGVVFVSNFYDDEPPILPDGEFTITLPALHFTYTSTAPSGN